MSPASSRVVHTSPPFSYEEAFSRNIGWLTTTEQRELRGKRVAIAGMGGVGGSHLVTLARLGIGAFTIADFDHFELANFNRQMGARISSLDRPKAATMADMARDINPELSITIFEEGVTDSNLDAFLQNVDVYVDGLDFFVIEMRRKIFARCRELGIPAVTAAPIGMGTAYLVFLPDRMSFEDYFRFEGIADDRQYVNFGLGLAPDGLHRSYLMDPTRWDFAGQRVSSTGLSCELAAGVAAAQVVKLLLKRGEIPAAPWHCHFDAYTGQGRKRWLPFGNGNPWQRIKLAIAYREVEARRADTIPQPEVRSRDIETILDLARWAPSANNSQPWRYEIIDDRHVRIVFLGPQKFFEQIMRGVPNLLFGGALLENMRIAASGCGYRLDCRFEQGEKDCSAFVSLTKDDGVPPSPLSPYIAERSVDRRRYRTMPITPLQKKALEEAVGDEFAIVWKESFAARLEASFLNVEATDLRLRLRQSYEDTRVELDWKRRFSPDAIPSCCIGVDPLTLRLLKWVMESWPRIEFMNKYAGGTLVPRLELDLLPGLFCGAHFVIVHKNASGETTPEATIAAGQAMQRFWLTATSLGLVMQPSFAPYVFGSYGSFEDAESTFLPRAERIRRKLEAYSGVDLAHLAFLGRIGVPTSRKIIGRSIRKPLEAFDERTHSI